LTRAAAASIKGGQTISLGAEHGRAEHGNPEDLLAA